MTYRPTQLLTLCGLLLALVASACGSGQDALPNGTGELASASTVQGDPARAGTLYLSTHDGELLTVDPTRESAGVLWERSDTQLPVFEVGPTANSKSLYVLLGDTALPVATSLHEIVDGTLTPAPNDLSGQVICLDNHQRSSIPLAHEARPSADELGSLFRPVSTSAVPVTDAWITAERPSAFCPRWTSQRDTVLTTVAENDSPTIETRLLIERASEQFDIATAGCLLVPMGVSPDDAFVAVSALCLENRSADAGLYILDLNKLDTTTSFTDLRKIAHGNFGNGTWDPTGTLIAAALTSDTPDEQGTLAIIDVATGELSELTLPNGAAPHSIAWLPTSVHR